VDNKSEALPKTWFDPMRPKSREEQFSARVMKKHILDHSVSWRLAECTLRLTLRKLAPYDLKLAYFRGNGSNPVELPERRSDDPGLSQNLNLICETLKVTAVCFSVQ
jgi:hypothetical protein